ncbi:MAG: flotillin-like FloA family protein [Balneolales bacterium]|nr:flotillin-like FloA family protein [Balneolales bacterium]
MDKVIIVFLGLVLLSLLVPTLFTLLKAYRFGAKISFMDAFGMTFRKTNTSDFFKGLSGFQKNVIDVDVAMLEAHYLADGDLLNCLNSFLYAKENGLDIDLYKIFAIDLAGKNVIESLKEANQA